MQILDDVDRALLRQLLRRGRASWAELGEKVKLSAPAVAERVRKLEERGIIQGYRAVLSADALGQELTAFIAVSLASFDQRDKFLKRIGNLPEVVECHHVAGEHDFLLKVRTRGTRELERLLTEDLKGRGGAGRTVTTIALATYKAATELPPEA